jgi:hypothetical protein
MKRDQRADMTIKTTVRRLKMLSAICDLNNPQEIIDFLAQKKAKDSYLDGIANAYNRFTRYNNIEWKKPIVRKLLT